MTHTLQSNNCAAREQQRRDYRAACASFDFDHLVRSGHALCLKRYPPRCAPLPGHHAPAREQPAKVRRVHKQHPGRAHTQAKWLLRRTGLRRPWSPCAAPPHHVVEVVACRGCRLATSRPQPRVKGLKSLSAGEDLRVSVRRPGGAKRGGEGREGWGRVKRGGGGGGGWWGRGGGAEKRDPPKVKMVICTTATLHGVYQQRTGRGVVRAAAWSEVRLRADSGSTLPGHATSNFFRDHIELFLLLSCFS